jgi:hypothetical protein
MNAVDLCAVAILAIVCVPEVVSAEEFDFDGSAFIHCVCPSPSQPGDLPGLAGRTGDMIPHSRDNALSFGAARAIQI